MTAGSCIYICTKFILQGTYETFAEAAKQHFNSSLSGRLVVSSGLGGMGGAQPLATTMNEGTFLAADVDESRIQKRIETKYCDLLLTDIDEAIDTALEWKEKKIAKSIGVVANAVDLLERLLARNVIPDILTDQTSAHDPLNGYVPRDLNMNDAEKLRSKSPQEYTERSIETMGDHVKAMLLSLIHI